MHSVIDQMIQDNARLQSQMVARTREVRSMMGTNVKNRDHNARAVVE